MPRFYVYTLFDPEKMRPRYIGKGLSRRTEDHFRQARQLDVGAKVVGIETKHVLLDDEQQQVHRPQESEKVKWLRGLLAKGYTHADIARVIARDLDEASALTLESFLIHHVYGQDNLLNVQAGHHHAQRFRPRGSWGPWSGAESYEHYVYVLRDPRVGGDHAYGTFYVGKGMGDRLQQHFRIASQEPSGEADPQRLTIIRNLIAEGHRPEEIGFIVARVQSAQEAFLIEALLIRFVYGIHVLANRIAGHHAWVVRPKDHWNPLYGFDHPRIVDPGSREDRSGLLAILLAEGLNLKLDQVREKLNTTLCFDAYKVLDAGELGMEASCEGTRIKVFTRRKRMQVELRPRSKAEQTWMQNHFHQLGLRDLLRRDSVFLPRAWQGVNMVDSVEPLIHRIKLLIELITAQRLDDLSGETKNLLGPFLGVKENYDPEVGDFEAQEGIVVQTLGSTHRNPNTSETPVVEPLEEEQPNWDNSHIPAGFYARLNQIKNQFPDIVFDEPKGRNSGEIAIQGLIGAEGVAPGAFLKVSARTAGYGLELRAFSKEQRVWLYARIVETLKGKLRNDFVFLPWCWKGSSNMAKTVEEAVVRIGMLMIILSAKNPEELDDEVRCLLDQ